MKTVGLPISHKENENRRALAVEEIRKMRFPELVYVEEGYGEVLGVSDDEYRAAGARVVSRAEVLTKDILCDPKIGDAEYLGSLSRGQTVFGWIHATQNRDITDSLIKSGLTAYAWEKMFDCGRHIFWRNNELAGEAAVIHAFQCYGRMPYETRVAVIGRGNTARGALKVLNMLGASVMQYDRHSEALLRREVLEYDVIVNCVLWDVSRKDHILSREDIRRMKPSAMIVDVSCDRNGGIETSRPTTFEAPTYVEEGILHYVVDHTPSLFYKTFTYDNSKVIYPYLEQLMADAPDKVLLDAKIMDHGVIVDEEITRFQGR
jgi:N5-(carboxyethyl)ornithine synthase